jgi:hypothetical protein
VVLTVSARYVSVVLILSAGYCVAVMTVSSRYGVVILTVSVGNDGLSILHNIHIAILDVNQPPRYFFLHGGWGIFVFISGEISPHSCIRLNSCYLHTLNSSWAGEGGGGRIGIFPHMTHQAGGGGVAREFGPQNTWKFRGPVQEFLLGE